MRFGCAFNPEDLDLPDGLAQCSSNVTGSLNTECCNTGTNCNEFVRLSCLNEPTTTTVPFTGVCVCVCVCVCVLGSICILCTISALLHEMRRMSLLIFESQTSSLHAYTVLLYGI